MSAGLRVHLQLETLQFSQRSSGASGPSHQVCPAVPRIGPPPSPPSRSEDFAVVTHTDTQTHTGHTPAPFRGSSHRQALGSVCDNGPHAAAGTSVPLPVSRDTRYIPEVTGLLQQAASRQKDQKKPLQVFS